MDVNKILRSDYLDIIFDGRNKAYGGYELRKKYPKRLRNAAALLGGLVLVLSAYPIVAGILNNDKVKGPVISTTIVRLEEPPIDPKTPPPPPPPPAPPAPPPPPRPTTSFAAPVIRENDQVREDERPVPPPEHFTAGLNNTPGDPNGIEGPSEPVKGTGLVETKVRTEPFVTVEQMPTFNGDLSQWLYDHIHYPDEAREAGSEGRSVIQFIVNTDGSISDVVVIRSAGSSALDAEAMRVISAMPKWNAGKQQGNAVRVYFSLPITFRLD